MVLTAHPRRQATTRAALSLVREYWPRRRQGSPDGLGRVDAERSPSHIPPVRRRGNPRRRTTRTERSATVHRVRRETGPLPQDVLPRSYDPLRSSRSRARSGHTLTVEAPRARWTCTRRAPVTNDRRGSDEQRAVAQIEGPETTWRRRTTASAQQVTARREEHRGGGRVQHDGCSHRIRAGSRRDRRR